MTTSGLIADAGVGMSQPRFLVMLVTSPNPALPAASGAAAGGGSTGAVPHGGQAVGGAVPATRGPPSFCGRLKHSSPPSSLPSLDSQF